MIITIIICITFIICFSIAGYIYYKLKINEDFKTKSEDIKRCIISFRDTYIEGLYSDKPKFRGNPIDIIHTLNFILKVLNNG